MSLGNWSVVFPLCPSFLEISIMPIFWLFGIVVTSWRLLILRVKSAVIFSPMPHAVGLFIFSQLRIWRFRMYRKQEG